MTESDSIITLTSDDGQSFPCRVLAVFEFRSREYAMLLHRKDDGDSSTVIMQLVQEGDSEAVFRTIKDDAEYESVVAYIRELTAPAVPGESDDY